MDKQTLSNYGWVIITVLVLAVMIALATPFGSYIKEGAKSTLTGLFESSENALNTGLNEAGVTLNKAEFGGVPTVGENNDTSNENLHHTGTVPEGGKYYTNVEHCYCGLKTNLPGETLNIECDFCYGTIGNTYATELAAGDQFPVPTRGDIYKFSDYKYCYQKSAASYNSSGFTSGANDVEWGVRYIASGKSKPDNILQSIANKPITNLDYAFYSSDIEIAPTLPQTTIMLKGTFIDCNNLKVAPAIPSDVIDLSYAFNSCENLKGTMIIDAEGTGPIFYTDYFIQNTQINAIKMSNGQPHPLEKKLLSEKGSYAFEVDYNNIGIKYKMDWNMTWKDYVESPYNYDNFTILKQNGQEYIVYANSADGTSCEVISVNGNPVTSERNPYEFEYYDTKLIYIDIAIAGETIPEGSRYYTNCEFCANCGYETGINGGNCGLCYEPLGINATSLVQFPIAPSYGDTFIHNGWQYMFTGSGWRLLYKGNGDASQNNYFKILFGYEI